MLDMHEVISSSLTAPTKNSREQSDREFLLITFSLFTGNIPENFEVRSNSEEAKSESYIGLDLSLNFLVELIMILIVNLFKNINNTGSFY